MGQDRALRPGAGRWRLAGAAVLLGLGLAAAGCGPHGGAQEAAHQSQRSAAPTASAAPASGKETVSMQQALDVIERLRKGESFRRGAEAFVTAEGTVDAAALARLGEAIDAAHGGLREQLIRLLAAVGREVDPLKKAGGNLIRDPAVVALLVAPGLSERGSGRDYALDTLEASVPRELLQPHHEAIAKDLEERPGTSALLLVAKAKPPQAAATVKALATGSQWSGSEEMAIAKAALGDTAEEKRLVDAFLAMKDPREKMRLAAVLGRVATPGALAALASEMRTDLVYEMPNVMRRSVRLDILAALSKSYPDKTFLWDNALSSDEDYARVEAFCEATFGTKWKTPRPPYLTIQGFPGH